MDGGGPAGPFLVPQFIDVETKIIGPITTRQFLLLMIAGMLDFIFYKLFYFNTFVIIAVPITVVIAIVAFFKVNGMPFHYFFLNVIQTTKRPKLRVWQKVMISHIPEKEKEESKRKFTPKAPLPGSRLSSLSLVVDTGGAFKEED